MSAIKRLGRGLLALLLIIWGVLYVLYELFDDLTKRR